MDYVIWHVPGLYWTVFVWTFSHTPCDYLAQDLLMKYGYIKKMSQREYVRRQAETVGLQVPLFWDEKPDKSKIVRDEISRLQKLAKETISNPEEAEQALTQASTDETKPSPTKN
jgi:hypothetical protein